MAFCWRNTAIYSGTFLFGLLYSIARERKVPYLRWILRPLPFWGLILLVMPMALDGGTHLLGLRDMSENVNMDMWYSLLFSSSGSQVFSINWWLRIVTGLLAALGVVWFLFGRFDNAVKESEAMWRSYNYRYGYGRAQTETANEPASKTTGEQAHRI